MEFEITKVGARADSLRDEKNLGVKGSGVRRAGWKKREQKKAGRKHIGETREIFLRTAAIKIKGKRGRKEGKGSHSRALSGRPKTTRQDLVAEKKKEKGKKAGEKLRDLRRTLNNKEVRRKKHICERNINPDLLAKKGRSPPPPTQTFARQNP